MKVFRDITTIQIKNPVATIGIFDGVHRAHQAIIHQLNAEAGRVDGESTLITLWPHPRIVLNKDADSLKLITTLEEKIERLEKAGVQNLVILPFDMMLAGTGFDTFVRETLVNRLNIHHLVVGFNHQFGKNREGNFANLQKLSEELDFNLSQVNPVVVNNERVSSSKIRQYLISGNIQEANEMLGYAFSLTGKVVSGNHIGRDMGFPTANISVAEVVKLIPQEGVYAVKVQVKDNLHSGMLNIGLRPTIDSNTKKSVIEVHLMNFEADIYGEEISVEFHARVRNEKKFDSKEELIRQLENDKVKVLNMLKSN